MTPEATQRFEYGRELAHNRWLSHRGRSDELEVQIQQDTRASRSDDRSNRQAFYVAMTAYRKELVRKQAEDK